MFACLCVRLLWVPDSLNVSAPSHPFPLQVASKRSALVLLGGICSCCLFILTSPTGGPILVTLSQLKLFKYNSYSFGWVKDKLCRLKKHNCLVSYGCRNLNLLNKHFKREVAQRHWKAGENQTLTCNISGSASFTHNLNSVVSRNNIKKTLVHVLVSEQASSPNPSILLSVQPVVHKPFKWTGNHSSRRADSFNNGKDSLGLGHI